MSVLIDQTDVVNLCEFMRCFALCDIRRTLAQDILTLVLALVLMLESRTFSQ